MHCLSSDVHVLVCLSGSQKHASKDPIKDDVDTKPIQSYLVPTPFVVASGSPCSVPSAKPGIFPVKNLSSQPHFTPSSKEPGRNQKHVAPQVPLEVHVVFPPPTKPRDSSVRTAEGPLPRGPLSYEALVHLRRSASTKKTPLCPSVDHTIELDKRLPVKVDRSNSEASMSNAGPPVVAPKPKKIPANISVKTQSEASVTSDSSCNAADPQVVRIEALQKLGLLKDQQSENDIVTPLVPPKLHSSLDPTPNRFKKGPSNVNTSRSPSFCYSQVPTAPKNRPLQSSASFHNYSRCDQPPVSVSHPAQASGLKAGGLERSATLDNHRNSGNHPETRHVASAKPVKTTSAAQHVPHKPSNSVGYTVMVVPGMGADRKEALRKLGLLKD